MMNPEKHWRLRKGIKFAVLMTLFVAVFSWVFMLLWNQLMPEVFGLRMIGYWQAFGLLVMSRILFGGRGPGFRHGGPPWKYRLHERWHQMTPEEREKFRSTLRDRRC